MNKIQLIILWLVGLAVSGIFNSTGLKLLRHAESSEKTWLAGYPITLIAGTVWAYILPLVILGAILLYSFRGRKRTPGPGRGRKNG